MGRIVVAGLFVVAVVLGLHREAVAAGCTTCDAERPIDVSHGPTRATFITWALGVDIAFTAADSIQLAGWHKVNPTVKGIQFVMALPVTLYGIDFVRSDTSDLPVWGLTLWSGALFAHGFWPVIESQLPVKEVLPKNVRIAPTTVMAWEDHKAHPGFGLSATF